MAISVATGYFRMVRKRSPPCFPLLPGWAGGSWRTFIRLGLSPPLRNVSDECVFSCQVAVSRNFSSHPPTATFEAPKRHLFFNFFKKIFSACFTLPIKQKCPSMLLDGHKTKKDPLPFDSESYDTIWNCKAISDDLHIFRFRFGERKVIIGDFFGDTSPN